MVGGLDHGEIEDHEVEVRDALRYGLVELADGVELLLEVVELLHLVGDLLGLDLRALEGVDKEGVVQKVAFGFVEQT